MKFGFCTGFATEFAKHIDFEMLEQIKAAGYDYVEFPLMQIVALDNAEFEQLADVLSSIELRSDAACNLFPGEVRVTGQSADSAKIDMYLDEAFARGKKLGIRKLIFGSSAARNLDANTSVEEGYRQLYELCIDKLLPRLSAYDMTLLIEPINRLEANFINTLADGMQLVKRINHPRIALLADSIHLLNNGETAEELRKNMDYIHHIHISEKERRLPTAAFTPQLDAMLGAIAEFGYDETISFETGPYTSSDTIAQALQNLKRRLRYAD